MITEYTETGLEGLEGKTGLEGLEGKTGLEGFNSEPNKRLRFTPSLASRGAGTIIAARQSGPRQDAGRQACAWRTEQGDGENWPSTGKAKVGRT